MPTNISINEYCKDPEKYKNDPSLDKQTIDYWNSYCDMEKEAGKKNTPDLKELSKVAPEAIQALLVGLVSPESLSILGGTMGYIITYKMAKNALKKWVLGRLDDEMIAAATELAKEGASKGVVNTSLIFTEAAGKMTVEEVGVETFVAARLIEGAEMLGSIIDEVLIIQMIVQLVGMVLDMWDPCNYNQELDSSTLDTFTDLYNKAFRDNVLIKVESIVDSYGHVTIGNIWPIEFYADRILTNEKEDHYKKIRFNLFAKYISSLQYNSDGLPINFEDDPAARLMTNSDFWIVEKTVSTYFANDNTVIANWFLKWWPILLAVVIGGIILLIIVRSKSE